MTAGTSNADIDRRRLLGTALAATTGFFVPGLAAAAAPLPADGGAPIRFQALRDGAPLGRHQVLLRRAGERLEVEVEIVFDVKLAIIPVYRYRHRNRELWEAGRLLRIETETDDNGTAYQVSGEAAGESFLVDGADGRLELPGDLLTTTYWDEQSLERGRWLDTQYGRMAEARVEQLPDQPLEVGQTSVDGRRYRLVGDISCELWYRDAHWVGLRFAAEDGSEIAYLPAVATDGL
jgi:hypothetical protein